MTNVNSAFYKSKNCYPIKFGQSFRLVYKRPSLPKDLDKQATFLTTMNFTNIATFSVLIISSIQAASLVGSNAPVTNVPAECSAQTVPAVSTSSNASASISDKVSRIMSLNLSKFGDLKQEQVKDFLTPEEWGRIDYYNNDAPLNATLLEQVIVTPSNSLTADQKVQKILGLGLVKFGDLKEEMVRHILTPEEWGRIDFYDNNAAVTKETLEAILKK